MIQPYAYGTEIILYAYGVYHMRTVYNIATH